MGDRVAILGGSVSGRDHFPFAVIDSFETGMDTLYPIGLTIDQACSAFYRVKRWQINVSVYYTAIPPDDDRDIVFALEVDAGEIDWPSVTTSVSGYDRESDLVMPRRTLVGSDDYATSFEVFFENIANVRFVFAAGLLYPTFYFQLDATIGTLDTVEEDSDVTMNWNVLGSPIASVVLTGRTGQAAQYSGTVNITAGEYWPYATKAGLPVYNTTTGAQLRDPLS